MVSCNDTKAQIKLYKSTSTYAGITSQETDTITNIETTYFSTKAGFMGKTASASISVSFVADTTSGTPTTIQVVLQGSNNGTTWWNYGGSTGLGTDGLNSDTLTITTAANSEFTISSMPGTTKFVNGTLRGNTGRKADYVRLVMVAASGTHNTRISNVRLWSFIN